MSPIKYMTTAIKFGGIRRNLEEEGTILYKDIMPLVEMTEDLLESHAKQVHQEMRLLKEVSELKSELGREDEF